MRKVELGPISWVSSPRVEPIDDDWGGVTATIRLDGSRSTLDAESGFDDFPHAEAVYVFDRVDPEGMPSTGRQGSTSSRTCPSSPPKVGSASPPEPIS